MTAALQRSPSRVLPHQATRLQRLGAWAVSWAVLGLAASCRLTVHDPSGVLSLARVRPVIFALWHNRLAFSMIVYRRLFRSGLGGRGLAALVSASRDGAFLAAILEALSATPVRGSSSRRGAQALLEMKSRADEGMHLAVTPDGPRGPKYHAQPGVLGLARITGFPIIPTSVNCSWRWDTPSWDGFQVPLPSARCQMVFGEPMWVDDSWDEARLEMGRVELEARLAAITED